IHTRAAMVAATPPATPPARTGGVVAGGPAFVAAPGPPRVGPVVPVRGTEAAAQPRLQQQFAYTNVKYVGTTIASPTVVATDIPQPPPVADPGSVTEPYTFDGVVVLAYVCKRLPKCPNPDPGLKWS